MIPNVTRGAKTGAVCCSTCGAYHATVTTSIEVAFEDRSGNLVDRHPVAAAFGEHLLHRGVQRWPSVASLQSVSSAVREIHDQLVAKYGRLGMPDP